MINAKRAIYQMIELTERTRERDGQPFDSLDYEHEYLRQLVARIQNWRTTRWPLDSRGRLS
jgi:hypothetical protein